MLIWLGIWGGTRLALAWIAGLIVCGAVTAALKIYFHACPIPGVALDSPSGHTSMSLFVFGGLTLVTAAQTRTWRRAAVLLLGGLLILAIAWSRAMLDYHSLPEVIIGLIIGTLALTLFWLPFRRFRPAQMPLWPLWIATLVPIVVLHGHQISTENLLHRIALYLRNVIDFCA